MPTPMDYARAAAKAAQKGDAEAVEYFRQKAAEGYAEESPRATEGMSTGDRFLSGVGRGMVNLARHAGNLVGAVSDERLADAKQLDQDLLDTTAGKVGNFVGETAATLPVGGVAGAGAKALGGRLLASGMAEGAAQGLLTADPGERLRGVVEGAALGAVLPGATAALRRIARPMNATKSARQLLERGVRLTPGELNPRGAVNRYEQALQSSAVGGTTLQRARDRAMSDWQRAAGEAAGPTGTKLTSSDPADMVSRLEQQYGKGYDEAIGGYDQLEPRIIRTQGGDVPLHDYPNAPGAITQAAEARYPGRLIKPEMRRELGGVMNAELGAIDKLRTTGRELQGVRSNIRRMARDTDVGGERALLRGGEGKITQAIESQIDPADAAKLRALDAQYGNFKVLQDAVARSRGAPGGFTPFQLESSIAKATDLGEYARGGGGPLRLLSRAGRNTFEQRVQPTGERQVLTGMLGKLGAPLIAASMAGATKINPKVLAGMTPAQRKVANFIRLLRRKHGTDLETARVLASGAANVNANEE